MRLFSTTFWRAALLGLSVVIGQSCSRRPVDLPSPAVTVAPVNEVSIAEAQTWYQSTYPSTFAAPSQNNVSHAAKNSSLAFTSTYLIWKRAITVGQGAQKLVLVPLASDQMLFANRRFQGTRYLVVTKNANETLNGNLVELLLRRTTTPIDTISLFTNLYRNFKEGHKTAPSQGEVFYFIYTADYYYITGQYFRNGQLLADHVRLKFFPTSALGQAKGSTTNRILDACTDWYCLETGQYITTTGDCGGNYVYDGNPDPTMPDGGGYSGPGDYGGTGGSGGSSTPIAPAATTTIISANLQPCAQNILAALQNLKGNDIGGLFNYFKNTTATTWNIQNAYIPNNANNLQVNALTSQSDGMPADFLSTTLNTTFLNNATDIAVSRTLIHESLHTYLIRWGYSQGMNVNTTMNQLVDGYLGSLSPNDITSQHDAMANIINQMALALQTQFPTLNLTYAQNLFWAGLTGTAAYNSLSDAQKASIVSANTAEVYNQSSAIGSKACN